MNVGMKVVFNIKYTKTQVGTQHMHFTVLHLSFSSRYKFIIILQMHNCQHMSNNQYCLQHVDNCHVRLNELVPTKLKIVIDSIMCLFKLYQILYMVTSL